MSEITPADFALFLLASGDMQPRQRARDQQADLAGLALKRRVLDLIVSYAPPADALEATLLRIVQEIGPPQGPTRALCASIRDEFADAASTPGFMEWLIEEAVRENAGKREKRRGKTLNQ